ncbi:DUF5107 domain-containing protein [Sphingobacterium sp. HMA12]|uniref:DUF5107 domain-containing protein n=1 Tax=Sphingobacterium sp. HMA12 TaxID=2050894 RepID=UPI000CEA4DCF|nr:DUF5107 domain-containing protein [Sphingobacterium sp. HMA12]
MKKWLVLLVLGHAMLTVLAQSPTKVSERKKQYITYPFSDPDPIASVQKLYPYFRFDGFTDTAIEKEWKTVVLENDYIRVQIMPEIGGKIWSAYDKIGKRDYIYNNGVVKFRDIAMRGPWTSGGIEANYGIIGHTPNTSTPVDYLLQNHADGSASCFIHAFDLLSRSNWTLEIRLEKDKGYFSTRSFWSNTSAVEQPYYTWMNLGVAAGEDLKFLYPGNRYIGHDGDAHPWPIDAKGRDLSHYRENAFGSSKSYHVLGAHSRAFGVYYKDRDYGIARYALREDKLGKKIFLWSQAGDGQIWEKLLTDQSGQYVEIQSGRLFNQNVSSSSLTPFKQIGFAPYQSDSWTEYWMPFAGIGQPKGFQLSAALQVKQEAKTLLLTVDPKRPIKDSIFALDSNGMMLGASFLVAQVGEVKQVALELKNDDIPYYLKMGPDYFDLRQDESGKALDRPMELIKESPPDSNQTKLFQARDLLRFRQYGAAEALLNGLTEKQVPKLDLLLERAKLAWFKMDYKACYAYARQALATDTYYAPANYYYGLAAIKLGKVQDALDGFEVASLDPVWRSPAYLQLAKHHYRIKQDEPALAYAEKAILSNALNIDALQLQLLIQKRKGIPMDTASYQRIARYDPFNTFIQFEEKNEVLSKQEFAAEKCFELAIWYADLHEYKRAAAVLHGSDPQTEMLLWLAWLTKNDPILSQSYLTRAVASNPAFVFPFREESEPVFEWAAERLKSWKVAYLQALLYRFRNQGQKAQQLLAIVENEPTDFGAYFALKSSLEGDKQIDLAIADMQRATTTEPHQWRYGLRLVALLNHGKRYEQALRVSGNYRRAFPRNYILTLAHVRTLLLNQEYVRAEAELKKVKILPFEGATEGHNYYVQTKLMLAYLYLRQQKYKEASLKVEESRAWPLHLGVGEPYGDEKNEILADWLAAFLQKQIGNSSAETSFLQHLSLHRETRNKYEYLLRQLAAQRVGIVPATETKNILATGEQSDRLLDQIKKDDLIAYWPELIRRIYFEQDQRMF